MKELCPAEALHEECGVFGIYDSTGKTNMVSAVYSALYPELQEHKYHR